MCKVICGFKCKDTKKIYHVGDHYEGDRLQELQEIGYVSVDESEGQLKEDSPEFPKHAGGGYYELSNGDKIKGKDAAKAAQAEIDASSN